MRLGGSAQFTPTEGGSILVLVIMVSSVVVEVALVGLTIVFLLTQGGFEIKISGEALALAGSGVEDAILRIARDKSFPVPPNPPNPYTIDFGNSRSVQVYICKDSLTGASPCSVPQVGKDEITATGIVLGTSRKLRAVLNKNTATGEVQRESSTEINL